MAEYKDIGVEVSNYVATIEIQRPPHNFFDNSLINQIADAFEAFDKDMNIRAYVLCAQGKSFCAGADFANRPQTGSAESGKHVLSAEEAARLGAASRFELASASREGNFTRITAMAAAALGAPIALLSVINGSQVLFSAAHGVDGTQPGTVMLHDPTVAAALGFGFHASVPLRTQDGHLIGTLCALDVTPRDVGVEDLASLEDLAGVVLRYLEPAPETQSAD